MGYRLLISLALCLLCGMAAAQTDTLALSNEVFPKSFEDPVALLDSLARADSLAKADTALSDDQILKMLASAGKDTVARVVDRGRDVSLLVNSKRARSVDVTPFKSENFIDNTFASLRVTSMSLSNPDYSVGMQLGVSYGKWLHPDHAVKVNLDMGSWKDNFDVTPVTGTELSASYIFNLTSYAFGYRTNRFCEVAIVGGAGYANSTLVRTSYDERIRKSGHAFTAHAGAIINFRAFKNINFFLEPQAVVYSNGMAVSYAGNWRSWLAAFRGTFGLTYNINQSYSEPSPLLQPSDQGYFVTFMGGPAFQNSKVVYDIVGVGRGLGVHVGLGVGKYYTDYFAIRYSGAYSRNGWVVYANKEYPCNYFSLRAEGMLDMFGLLRRAFSGDKPVKPSFLSASVLLGPELGYMYKADRYDVIQGLYMGLTGGVQAKLRLASRLSLFFEPRFSMVWYDAPANSASILNDHRNYYDGLLNFNAGIEFTL